MLGEVLVVALLMEELCDCIDVDEVGDGEDEFGFPSRDSFAIGEQLAAFVVDIISELLMTGRYLFEGSPALASAKGSIVVIDLLQQHLHQYISVYTYYQH